MSQQQSIGQVEKICELSFQMFSPFEIDNEQYVCASNGEIYKIKDGQMKCEFNFGGNPSSVIINQDEKVIFVADIQQKIISVRSLDKPNDEPEILRDYEGQTFLGPNSLVLSKANNCIYFTDSGMFGETTLDQNDGSVFMIDLELQMVRPLAHNCLSYPSGLALSKNEKIIYVSETSKNRILRFVQSSQGIYYYSNFMQFQGRYGPASLTISSSDFLYVVRQELGCINMDGLISVINTQNAQVVGNISLKQQHDISGLYVSLTQNNVLYATDNSKFPCFIKVTYQPFEQDEEKN